MSSRKREVRTYETMAINGLWREPTQSVEPIYKAIGVCIYSHVHMPKSLCAILEPTGNIVERTLAGE